MKASLWFVAGIDIHDNPVWDTCKAESQKEAVRYAEVKYDLDFAAAYSTLDNALREVMLLEKLCRKEDNDVRTLRICS